MIKYTKEQVKEVNLMMSNHECIDIPTNCFKTLSLTQLEGNYFEIEAHIIDNGIDFSFSADFTISPLQRLNKEPHISHIEVILNNGEEINGQMIWSEGTYPNNKYQKSKLISYKELLLSVKKSNLTFSLNKVLKFKPGTVVMDQEGVEYTVKRNKNVKYLENTIVSNKILNSKFTIKELKNK